MDPSLNMYTLFKTDSSTQKKLKWKLQKVDGCSEKCTECKIFESETPLCKSCLDGFIPDKNLCLPPDYNNCKFLHGSACLECDKETKYFIKINI